MPTSPVFRPNQPVSSTWSPSGGWYNAGQQSTQSSNRPRFYSTANGPVTLPSDWSDDDARQWVQAYDEYIAKLTQQWQETSGLERRQIESQIEDAKKARENQMEIAQIQDRTSRYGIDVGSRDRLIALKEQARQFDASHGLEMQKLGLDRAKTATDYLSTSDRFVQAGDFLNLSGRVLAGQPGAGNGSGATPQMKTMSDYAALESGGNPGRQVNPTQAAAGQGAGADQRVKALKAVIEAAPPSADQGIDANGYHVLNAAKAIYAMNLNPQQQAAINSSDEYKSMLGSAGRRLGFNADQWWKKQRQTLPGQGSARRAA